jgi:hypothetical protein
MPTLTFPTLSRGPASLAWALQSATLQHQSPLSGATRTISTPGSRWTFSASWPALAYADRSKVEAFLASLNGRAGRFYFSPPEYYFPKGSARSATVNGGSQTGSSLNVTMTAFWTLKAGDFLEVNGELKRVTSDMSADSNGLGTVNFAPPLRASPANGAAISLQAPTATFMLMDDKAGVTVGPGGFADFTIDAIETFL